MVIVPEPAREVEGSATPNHHRGAAVGERVLAGDPRCASRELLGNIGIGGDQSASGCSKWNQPGQMPAANPCWAGPDGFLVSEKILQVLLSKSVFLAGILLHYGRYMEGQQQAQANHGCALQSPA